MENAVWTRIAKNTYALKVEGATLYRYRYKGSFGMVSVPDAPAFEAVELEAFDAIGGVTDQSVTINIENLKNLKI